RGSWSGWWSRSVADQFLYENGLVSARFPMHVEIAQAEYAFGQRNTDGLIRRVAFGFALHDRHYGPTSFAPFSTVTANPGEEDLRLRWASLRLTFWQPEYIERRGIELFDPVEDFDVGSLASMEGGMALKALGSTADEGIAKLRMDVGHDTQRFGFGLARGRFSTRIRRELLETLAQLDARWIQQPRPNVAVVVAALGEAAQNAPREVQSVIGGLNGLRAYGVQALAGTQVWRFNGEARWVAARDVLDLASVGGAVFVDSARAW